MFEGARFSQVIEKKKNGFPWCKWRFENGSGGLLIFFNKCLCKKTRGYLGITFSMNRVDIPRSRYLENHFVSDTLKYLGARKPKLCYFWEAAKWVGVIQRRFGAGYTVRVREWASSKDDLLWTRNNGVFAEFIHSDWIKNACSIC